MTNLVHSFPPAAARGAVHVQPASSIRFDWLATLLNGALVGGVYLDGWAHEQGRVDTSFFTPWHGLMYGAMGVVFLFLLVPFVANVLRGAAPRRALPIGYGLSLGGTLVFALGGVGDLVWHTLFGIEDGLEALLSPTHLVLALGWVLIVSGPLRAAWARANEPRRWSSQLPKIFSLAWVLSALTFFTTYANPFGHMVAAIGEHSAASGSALALGITGFLVQSALLMGGVLLALRRWTLPRGSCTVIMVLNVALVSTLHEQYVLIVVAALAGLLADLMYAWLQPSQTRPGALRAWAFAVPAMLSALYFGALLLTSGIVWTVHVWTGAILLAGGVGLLLSYVAVPPAVPVQEEC